jgi:hypothetical protein
MFQRARLLLVLVTLTLGMILSLCLERPAIASTETPSDSVISIKSVSTRYDSEFETFHILGELVNTLKVPVENLQLNVTFYDSQGNLTGTIISSPFFTKLGPGEKSAFDVSVRGREAADLLNFSYYKISKTFERTEQEKEKLLKLDIRQMSVDTCGYYRIEGTIANLARDHTNGVSVYGAFYNEQNQIVATGITAIKDRIDSTKNNDFALTVDRQALPHFAYYSLNVQSENYTAASFEGEEDLTNFHSLKPIGGKIMTVTTERETYSINDDKVSVRGMIPIEEVKKREENSLVLIKILTGSGSVPVLVTAPVAKEGTFAREVEFQMDESMKGQAFRVRAEYFGMMAESTFSVAHAAGSDELPVCENPQKIAIAELKTVNDVSSKANVTSFLSGSELSKDSDVMLTATVDNELSRRQNVTLIFEVFDSRGVVVFLHTTTSEIDPNARQEIQVPWRPETEGMFVIKSFAVSTLYQPVLLSTGAPLSVKVL